jgi:acyl-CoA thioester hydrolase
MSYQVEFTTKWSDFDPNRHMRHTAYNEYAAEVRIRYFAFAGFPIDTFTEDHIGPILFTENTSFRKEIHIGENIRVNAKLLALSENNRKWKIRHQILNQNGDVSATIEVYGAWIDLNKRKLTIPSKKYEPLFDALEKTEDFEMI